MSLSAPTGLLATALVLAAAPVASPQSFAPVVVASIHDEPPDGVGDSFNAPPFEGLLREQTTREDRAIQEFDVSGLSGAVISSATISGRISVNNAADNGPRFFDFLLYDGNGAADLSDFEIQAVYVGTDSYHPPNDTQLDYSFDCTSQVQQLLLAGSGFIGLKVDCSSQPNFPNILSEDLSQLTVVLGGAGVAYCFGDGGGTTCPCGNAGAPGRGCANSSEPAGGGLAAGGSDSVAADDLVLAGSGLVPFQPGLYFQGDNEVNGGAGLPFGDGLRCAGGNVIRLQTVTAGATGLSATSVDVAAGGGAAPGETLRYQLWYRDPGGSPCGTGFNLTNGLAVTWAP